MSNPCTSNPCQQHGICSLQNSTSFACTCSQGYTGNLCQTLVRLYSKISKYTKLKQNTKIFKIQTSMSSTSPTTLGVCQNLPSQDATCKFFVSQYGLTYCTNKNIFINGALFSQVCKFSCNLCPLQNSTIASTQSSTTSSTSCVDSQNNCASWASYCNLLVNLNPNPCRKTCNVCTNGAISSTTTTTTITTKVPCVDSQANCAYWANYCQFLSGLNPNPCPKTCKTCS